MSEVPLPFRAQAAVFEVQPRMDAARRKRAESLPQSGLQEPLLEQGKKANYTSVKSGFFCPRAVHGSYSPIPTRFLFLILCRLMNSEL